jgi:hypothetical protein
MLPNLSRGRCALTLTACNNKMLLETFQRQEDDKGFRMPVQIEIDKEKIVAFCDKWKVKEFALFGSVLREDFRPDSDIDVLVSFSEDADWSLYDWVDMIDDLKTIFGHEVDLVEKGTLRNPFRRRHIMNNKETIYAA